MCTLTWMHTPFYPHSVLQQLGPCKHNHLITPTSPGTDTWSILCPLRPTRVRPGQPFSHEPLLSYLWPGGSLGQTLGSLPVAQPQPPGPARLCLKARVSTIKGMRTDLCLCTFFSALSETICALWVELGDL